MRFVEKARDPISSMTHLCGALLSIAGTVMMILKSTMIDHLSTKTVISLEVFGISMVLLYLTSGIYHYISGSEKLIKCMRKADHAAIYLLIAGTYTPILLNIFSPEKGIPMAVIIWIIGILGIILKLFCINAPRWLYTLAYILMGWFIVLDLKSFVQLPFGAIALIVAGGIFYTVGALFYIMKKPNFSKKFGFHEIFHIFIMLGTLMHFIMVYFYIA